MTEMAMGLEAIRRKAIRDRELQEKRMRNSEIQKAKAQVNTNDLMDLRNIMKSDDAKTTASYFDKEVAERELKDFLDRNRMHSYADNVMLFAKEITGRAVGTYEIRRIATFLDDFLSNYKVRNK